MPASDDREWMMRALDLASSGLGETWPNPSVGCVLVRDDVVLGEGQTSLGGRPHAETNALQAASGVVSGAHAFVTLEPCAHHGVTPPCAAALIDAAIRRVVIGAVDPDPRVNGRGISMLRDAGIEVVTDVCGEAARSTLSAFFHKLRTGRPFVFLGAPARLIAARRADAVVETDAAVRRVEGLADRGRLKLRVPQGSRPMELLERLGAHGLTSVYVPSDDPLAPSFTDEGLVDERL